MYVRVPSRSLRLTNRFLLPAQDKSVAFKIFELGLKKYGDIPEYILAYIDYLSHLNGRPPVRVSDVFFSAVKVLPSVTVTGGSCLTLCHVMCLQRITTLGFCLNASSPQEVCHQRSQGEASLIYAALGPMSESSAVFLMYTFCRMFSPQRGLGSVPGFREQHRRPGQYSEGGAQTIHCLQGWVWGQRDSLACGPIQVHGPVSLLCQRTQGPWIQGAQFASLCISSRTEPSSPSCDVEPGFCRVLAGCVPCQTGSAAPGDGGGALGTYIKGRSRPETRVSQTWHQPDDPLPAASPRPYVAR